MQPPDFEHRLSDFLGRYVAGFESLLSVERMSGGASQETYRLRIREAHGERALALRRAPGGQESERGLGRPKLRVQAELMRQSRLAMVPVPEVYGILSTTDGLGEGFVMEWIDGETLGSRIVRSPDLATTRPRLAYECGRIIARIHAIDLHQTGLARQLDLVTPQTFVESTWDRYRSFNTPQPMIDYVARWLLSHLPDTEAVRLVHNDFRNGNLIISPQGIVGVLDWEGTHIGDPMRDLGWICTNSWRFGRSDLPVGGFGEYADLFRGYESVSGIRVDPAHVKFWEVFGSFWWAVGCLGMAEHFRTGPDKTVERPGIGRRSSECQVDCANLLIRGPVALVEGEPFSSTLDMPRTDELLSSVRDYLRNDVMTATEGRLNFLARVASNSLDIVLRELSLGAPQRALELERLRALLDSNDDLESLSWRLVHALRDGSMPLDNPGLADHLRQTVVNQLAIDQPSYSGMKNAVGFAQLT